MPQFTFKNLPDGFEFPISRREIRAFVKGSAAHFERIEFAGLSSSEGLYSNVFSQTHYVCYLRARWENGEWIFELEVRGLKPERYQGRRAEIVRALSKEIAKWIGAKRALPHTAPHKPCRAMVSFDLTEKSEVTATLSECRY